MCRLCWTTLATERLFVHDAKDSGRAATATALEYALPTCCSPLFREGTFDYSVQTALVEHTDKDCRWGFTVDIEVHEADLGGSEAGLDGPNRHRAKASTRSAEGHHVCHSLLATNDASGLEELFDAAAGFGAAACDFLQRPGQGQRYLHVVDERERAFGELRLSPTESVGKSDVVGRKSQEQPFLGARLGALLNELRLDF